jgi:molybdopterin-guanine dinucleotide biosynthesis protein A
MTEESLAVGTIVLAGGESSRMGRSKAWLTFEGEPLLTRVVRRLATGFAPLVVVAAPDQVLPALPAHVQVARDRVAREGPLEGLAVGLEHLASSSRRAFVCTCDAPFVTSTLAVALANLCERDAAVPEVDGRLHPLAAVYATDTHRVARALRDADERRVTAFVGAIQATRVGADRLLAHEALRSEDPELASLVNVNTPADLEAALKRRATSA